MSNPARTEEDVTAGLMAVIQWGGNYAEASRTLKAAGMMDIMPATLRGWVMHRYADRYRELREKHREQLEKQLADRFADLATHAAGGSWKGVDRAIELLDAGKDRDPARTAANLASVADKMTGKMLAVTGRPSAGPQLDDRTIEQRLRKLAQMGVIKIPEVVEATSAPDDGQTPPGALAQGDDAPHADANLLPKT